MITIDLPPVGIKILSDTRRGFDGVVSFQGVSYCEAIFNATFGQELLIKPDSIKVCQWVPIVLGFKTAANTFEHTIQPHLPRGTAGIYMAPMHLFRAGITPDVVIIRTNPENFQTMIDLLGWESFIDPSPYRQDVTALHTFREAPPRGFSAWAIRNVNAWLSAWNRLGVWHRFTTILFRSTLVTRLFDRFITVYMANMSMCRNSLVIPFQTGRANISYFCTGGIAWGKNTSEHMTAGFPWKLYQSLNLTLDYPGKRTDDSRLKDLAAVKEQLVARDDGGGCTSQSCGGK